MQMWKGLIVLVLISFSWRTQAHPSLHSALALDVKENNVDAELRVALTELEAVLRKPLAVEPEDSVHRFRAEIQDYIAQHIHVRSVDGKPWTLVIDPHLAVTAKDGPLDLVAQLKLFPAPGSNQRDFILESDLILHQAINHKLFVTLRSDWHTGIFEDNARLIKIIQFLHSSVHVDLTQGSAWLGFLATFKLGMRHIAEGTDHLLFLLMLMLPAVLTARNGRWAAFRGTGSSMTQLLKIITAFTIGHSLTLIIGALAWFRLPVPLIESLIAVSIFISAVHVLRPIFPDREFLVAAGFGLIHGLAFSSVLVAFNLGTRELILSILGFNLGIEVMQLAIVSVLVPWLMILAKDSWYGYLRLGLAGFGGLAALGWLGERSLGFFNPMASAVELAERHALEITVALAVLVCLRTLLVHHRTPALKRK